MRDRGTATPKDQFSVTDVVVAVKTNLVVGPVRVVDLVAGGEDELLVDAGGIASGKGEYRR